MIKSPVSVTVQLVGMEFDSPSKDDNHRKGNRNFFQFKGFPGRVKSSRGVGETPRASRGSGSYLDQRERERFLTGLGSGDPLLSRDSSASNRNESKVRDHDPVDAVRPAVLTTS